MKFFNLLKKELSELINAQMIASLAIVFIMFYILGTVMQTTVEKAAKTEYTINLSDRDHTELTEKFIEDLRENGAKVNEFTTSGDDYGAILEATDQESLLIIPEGFSAAVEKGEIPDLISLSGMKSSAVMSNITNDTSSAVSLVKHCLTTKFAEQAGLSIEDINLINNPLKVDENTIINGKSANVSTTAIVSKLSMQNMILPIVVLILIAMTSQSIMSSIANEKIDKTLETLLSAPVSRTSILVAKTLAAAIVALFNAVCYMVGFSMFSKNATNSLNGSIGDAMTAILPVDDAMEKLGLNLGAGDYFLVGVQLFLTIMICLSISIVLGALVNDSKQSQTMVMPLMFMAMIPYIISMVSDPNSLPTAARILVYAIPFTHTFSAISNIAFGNMTVFFIGMAYQAVIFVVCLAVALKLFKSDKMLTISLNFGQKNKFRKKGSKAEE